MQGQKAYKSIEQYNQPEQWVAQHGKKTGATNQQRASGQISAQSNYVLRHKQQVAISQIWCKTNIENFVWLTLVRVISIVALVTILNYNPQVFRYALKHSELVYASLAFIGILYLLLSHTHLGVAKPLNLFLTALSTINMGFIISYGVQRIDWKHHEKFIAIPLLCSIVFIALIGIATKVCQWLRKQHESLKQAAVSINILCLCCMLFFGVNQSISIALIVSLHLLISTQIVEGFTALLNNKKDDVSAKVSQIMLVGLEVAHLLMVFIIIAMETFSAKVNLPVQ